MSDTAERTARMAEEKLNPALEVAEAVGEIQRLAGLSVIEYEQCRREVAKKLDMRPAVLDSEVKKARPAELGDTDRQGQPLGLDDPEPWPEPVAGDALLDEIVMRVRRYLVLPDGAAEVLALWAVHAHAFEAFYYTPRLAITAPEKQCGKTVVLDVLECLTPRAIRTENLTTAVLFRIVDAHQPVLLIDEFDTFLKNSDELRGAVNAGHRRGGVMLRCEGDENEVRAFKTFAPVALAGIGKLPGTIADRSIPITMRRALPDETVRPFRGDRAHQERELCRQAARWADDNRVTLEHHEPEVPGWMFNRQADNWRPLLTIADIAGGDWPEHARAVAARICGSADDETSIRVQLLKDIGDLFKKHGTDQLSSETIVSDLGDMEDRLWPEWGRTGKPISAPQVARQLKPFGISPNGIRIGDPLKDNAYKLEKRKKKKGKHKTEDDPRREIDGYRFHDSVHFAFVAILGWSPVMRGLMKRKRKSSKDVDDADDGARAQVVEEMIVKLAHSYAVGIDKRKLLDDEEIVTFDLLKRIKILADGLEVTGARKGAKSVEYWEWAEAILAGFHVYNKLRRKGKGRLRVNLTERRIDFFELKEDEENIFPFKE